MNQFVISRLQRQVERETIIRELYRWAGIDGSQAAGFVRYAEIIHRCEIARRRRQFTQLAVYASTSLSGALFNLLVGVVFIEFYQSYGGCAGLVILISSALLVGGFVGFVRTLNEI